ncbi:MAG: DUF6075 family protein [Lachnospiraceae bacterium]|nr:DUF6075 family protein [Lachnospiraceae bacterium]
MAADIIFNGKEHETTFYTWMKSIGGNFGDSERVALFYVLSITDDCRNHIDDLYNFNSHCVKPGALHHGWITSSDTRTIRLAFNLFNGKVPTALEESSESSDNLYNKEGEFEYDKSELLGSTPSSIFCDSLAIYFVQGLKLRYQCYFE